MTTSRRFADRKVDKFEKNIMKRGAVPETTAKKSKDYPIGPVLLGFFVFVVIGSSSQPTRIIKSTEKGQRSAAASVLLHKLRWSTPGLQFNCPSTKQRNHDSSFPHNKIPHDLCQLAIRMATPATGAGEQFKPEAAIINYFGLDKFVSVACWTIDLAGVPRIFTDDAHKALLLEHQFSDPEDDGFLVC